MAENEKNESPADESPADDDAGGDEGSASEASAPRDEPEVSEPEVSEPEVSEPEAAQQRDVRNYLLQPPFQVQLAIYNCVLALFFAAGLVGVLQSKLSRLETHLGYVPDVPAAVTDALQTTLSDSALYMVILTLIFVAASAAVTIILTHRLVGPAYAFRRQINELSSGRYDARVQLRRHDAFLEVADDLNKLAETLQRERGGLASSANSLIEMDP